MVRRIVVALALIVMVWLDSVQLRFFGLPWALALGCAIASVAPVLLAPRRPVLAWLVLVVELAGYVFVMGVGIGPGYNDAGWPWPVFSTIGFALVLFLTARQVADRRRIGLIGLATLVDFGLAYLLAGTSAGTVGFLTVMTAGLLAWGDSVRVREAAQRALAAETERRRLDRQRQVVAAERARIARELHDLVAHHVSMIAIQAEAAPHRIAELPQEAHRTFEAIRSASKEAMTEMRRILGLLRSDDEDADTSPQPGLADLDALVGDANRAGIEVSLTISGAVEPPAGVAVSAYRIVAEALTNAVRHAPGSRVVVVLELDESNLRLTVTDSGAAPGATPDGPGSGLGLVGIRERVSVLGGTLRTGSRVGGGFEVAAELPMDDRTGVAE